MALSWRQSISTRGMVGVTVDEGLDLTQSFRKRLRIRERTITEEPKSRFPELFDLCPLLRIFRPRCFERSAHFSKRPGTLRAGGQKFGIGTFEALATLETGMGDKIWPSRRFGLRIRRLPISDIPPQVHPAIFFGFGRHGAVILEEQAADDNWTETLFGSGLMCCAACRYPHRI